MKKNNPPDPIPHVIPPVDQTPPEPPKKLPLKTTIAALIKQYGWDEVSDEILDQRI